MVIGKLRVATHLVKWRGELSNTQVTKLDDAGVDGPAQSQAGVPSSIPTDARPLDQQEQWGANFRSQAGLTRLQSKAKYRKKGGSGGMLSLYPAGTSKQGTITDRTTFEIGAEGDEQWYEEVVEKTSEFSEAHRATSTAREHEMYMKNISDWVVSIGFPPLVRKAEPGEKRAFGGIALIEDEFLLGVHVQGLDVRDNCF